MAEYKKIVESPMKISKLNLPQLEDNANNYAFTNAIKIRIGNVPANKFESYDVYSYKVGNTNYDLFVDGAYTVAFFSYSVQGPIMLEKQVWQDGLNLGLCRKIIFNYYLEKYDEIISDGQHTELGEKYWKKLLVEAGRLGFRVKLVVDGRHEAIDFEKLDDYFSNSPKFSGIRFSIRKTP